MLVKSPCTYICPDRTIEPVNCHMTCQHYVEFVKNKREREQLIKEYKASLYLAIRDGSGQR